MNVDEQQLSGGLVVAVKFEIKLTEMISYCFTVCSNYDSGKSQLFGVACNAFHLTWSVPTLLWWSNSKSIVSLSLGGFRLYTYIFQCCHQIWLSRGIRKERNVSETCPQRFSAKKMQFTVIKPLQRKGKYLPLPGGFWPVFFSFVKFGLFMEHNLRPSVRQLSRDQLVGHYQKNRTVWQCWYWVLLKESWLPLQILHANHIWTAKKLVHQGSSLKGMRIVTNE